MNSLRLKTGSPVSPLLPLSVPVPSLVPTKSFLINLFSIYFYCRLWKPLQPSLLPAVS
jgi:hypothetical protein